MPNTVQESLIVLGGTGNLRTQVLPMLVDTRYHLVVFSRREVSGGPFSDAQISVKISSQDEPAFIESLVATALQHAEAIHGALFLNGGFEADNGSGGAYATAKMAVDSLAREIQREYDPEVVDVLRPKMIGTKKGQNAPADLAQEMLEAVRRSESIHGAGA